MAKKKFSNKKKKQANIKNSTIESIDKTRTGGQIAIKGYSYQLLYSCFFALSKINENAIIRLEGIEDIDMITLNNSENHISHIQLKFSSLKQDASFLKGILKNFLEIYLIDSNRNFKLVYDFDVAKGNLTKLIEKKMDEPSNNYWKSIIQEIKEENPQWNWNNFNFSTFVNKLSFERIEKKKLPSDIERFLKINYDIMTDNISLYANSFRFFFLEKMEKRECSNKQEIDSLIHQVSFDISKGSKNPAHNWIEKISFQGNSNNDDSFFEGKKTTYQDIARNLPVKRALLEDVVTNSIKENKVTVIKASSGQGKTTLALKVAYNLQNEYSNYRLLWCNDSKELMNIVSYFESRIRMGEKPLIIIDNLDSDLKEWNKLAQLLQEKVNHNYRIMITTREDDWYRYKGELSNLRSIKPIELFLEEEEAKGIFEKLRQKNKLHSSINDWRSSFEVVKDRSLLIEYIYLLTHGEMLSERIDYQIKAISNSDSGKTIQEILRKVCFADICGVKISASKLIDSIKEQTKHPLSEVLKSIEHEFLIKIDCSEKYIEGLHPVRSKHVIDRLHEFAEIETTALEVSNIIDPSYYSKMFSEFPSIVKNKEKFYKKLTNLLWNKDDLSPFVKALRGTFSGSVQLYFQSNQLAYEEANKHGGLLLFDTELNPFTTFDEIGVTLNPLDEFKEMLPDNDNVNYLCELRDKTERINLSQTDTFYLCLALFDRLEVGKAFDVTTDIASYAIISHWLINIDFSFNLASKISLEILWRNSKQYSLETISSLMYTSFCGNKANYMEFTEKNLSSILLYLRKQTKSIKITTNGDFDEIHVNYILLTNEIEKANDESVSRLKTICKILPIFKTYCADAIRPNIKIISAYNIPDDSHKTMPIRNLIIMFHHEFSVIWDKTIKRNFEFSTIFEWLNHWYSIRKNLTILLSNIISYIYKLLEGKIPNKSYGIEIDKTWAEINEQLIEEKCSPREDRPFEEKTTITIGFNKIKNGFFQNIQTFFLHLFAFLSKNEQSHIALWSIKEAISNLKITQDFFNKISQSQEICKRQVLFPQFR